MRVIEASTGDSRGSPNWKSGQLGVWRVPPFKSYVSACAYMDAFRIESEQ